MKSIIDLENERFEWSKEVFPEATAYSSLQKLKEEIKELEENIKQGVKDPIEYADALMCLLDSASRHGIKPEYIILAFEKKLAINKNREWVKNSDNTYSHKKTPITPDERATNATRNPNETSTQPA